MTSVARLGITPTCWTNDDFPLIGNDIPFEQCLSEIAFAGFRGCSIGHKFPTDVRQLASALTLRDLSITEPWVSTFFTVPDGRDRTNSDFQKRLDFLTALNNAIGDPARRTTIIGVAEFGHSIHLQAVSLKNNKPEFKDERLAALAEGLNDLGRLAENEGFKLAYHPHMGTGIQTQDDVNKLMLQTDPSVHLLLDTGHLTWAGANLHEVITNHGARIAHVHLKDIRQQVRDNTTLDTASFEEFVRLGIFTVPGDDGGLVDFPAVLNALKDVRYDGWLVVEAEQDPLRTGTLPGLPGLYYAKLAREYLRSLGL
ncbi:myo-inosose-2 dehydratase [Actinophytocola sp.]|uniref:myo-inosose-2 dehydratase n=1 Tax=Actinophytocola sp. TaxID=1872138 RepID=UPI002ED038AD